MTWFLPDVCDGSVSEDSSLEMPPDVFEGSVSEDSCLEPPPEQQEIMWMNKIVQAKNSPPYLHQCNFSEITEIVWGVHLPFARNCYINALSFKDVS